MSRFDFHGVAGHLTNHPRWMIRVIQLAIFVLAGVFAVISAPSPNVITYRQVGVDALTTGGTIQSMRRLYELTQEELVQQNRNWQVSYVGPLQSWFEDRAGLYRWGVGGKPSSGFPALHGVKYLALNYCWSKDSVASQPQMAQFALKRYAQVVMATGRYIQAMKMGTK